MESELVYKMENSTFVIAHNGRGLILCITLDFRLPFPDSVGAIFPGPATTQKVRVLNGFPSWRGYNDLQFWACWLGG